MGPLQCNDVTEDSVTLSWQAPESDGGCHLTGYIIEKSDARRPRWIRVGKIPCDQTSILVGSLFENTEYYFRVMAENDIGVSPPLENKIAFTPKNPYGIFFIDIQISISMTE